MTGNNFITPAELERHIDAARRLRAETQAAGAIWILNTLAGAVGVIRRLLLRITAHASRQPYPGFFVGRPARTGNSPRI